MGTKIQCKTYLPAFYSVKDLNGHVNNNRVSLLNHEEQTLRSVQHFDFFASCVPVDGYFEYDKEKVRQTILKHESIFRHQLQELHRLHRRQMELMSELKTREVQKNSMKAETLHFGHFLSHAPPSDVKRAWNVSHFPSLNSGSALVSTSGTSYSHSPFEFIKGENRASHFSSRDKEIPRAGNEDRYNSNTTTLEFSKRTNRLADLNEPILLDEAPILASNANPDRINSLADSIESMDKLSRNHIIRRNGGNGFNHMQSVSGRNGHEHLIIDINADAHSDSSHTPFPSNNTKAEHPKRRTIFGVVISEGNEERSMTVSSGSCNGVKQNLDHNGGKVHMNGDIRMTSSSKGDGASHSSQLNAREVNGCSSVGFNYANGKSVMATKVDTEKPVMSQNVAYCQTKRESSKGALPWFMVKSQHGLDQSKEGENYYQTNLDLLKNCSQQIFRKSETDEGFSRILNRKQEAKPSTSIKDSEHSNIEVVDSATTVKKIFGVPIFKSSKDVVNSADSLSRASFQDVHGVNSKNVLADNTVSKNQFDAKDNIIEKRLDNNISSLSPQIDLNLSLDEEEVSPMPSLPRAVVEIELDDEAPALLESEEILSLEAESRDIKSGLEEFKEPRGEVARRAAEAIVSISQTVNNSFLNIHSESAATACLEWFAELITSEVNGDECRIMEASSGKQRGNSSDEDSIPDGMDYFEFATLKLRDMKEEGGQCYEPSILEIHNDDEEEEIGAGTTQSKRPRRGQARRGRQRKDFQRDVLPGIMSLSKHELSEDILTFEELLRTSGCSWQSCLSQKKATKSGRGRKRRGGSTTPSPIKTATPSNQPLCNEVEVEKASLTGWGKRTRRLPRQRCPTTHHVPLMQC
nr:uncharacterized protein LOC109189230 isoform X1 [Ipomoea batatas]